MSDETQGQLDQVIDQGEGQQPAATPTAQEPQVDEEKEALENSKNPERTKAYIDKLKAQLKDKENPQPQKPSLLEAYMSTQPPVVAQPPYVPPQTVVPQAQVEAIKQELVDKDGYVNGVEFERRLSLAEQAEKRASEAERKAQSALERIGRYEIDAQKKALYQNYPELDPSSDSFDDKAYDLVKKEMLQQLVDTGSQDAVKAASKMSEYFRKPSVSPAQQETLQQRSQATASVGSGTPRALSTADEVDLRTRSLTDDEAMEERIRRLG